MCDAVDVAKTNEILARFRPIAPRPELPSMPAVDGDAASQKLAASAAAVQQLCRPCRVRKRGRTSHLPVPMKRHKPLLPVRPLPPIMASHVPLSAPQLGLAGQGFASGPPPSVVQLQPEMVVGGPGDILTLSLVPGTTMEVAPGVPVERDLLQELQKPKVIVPHPVRPVGSSISVGQISGGSSSADAVPPTAKRPEEVELEVESETLPAVVSDSKNRVRLANSAYKEMVGQPKCSWLDSMVSPGAGGLKLASTRINGEVMLDLPDSPVPAAANGFSCKVKIEWASNNGKKTFINAPCDVIKLRCESKDYLFAWRFHTNETSETNCKA